MSSRISSKMFYNFLDMYVKLKALKCKVKYFDLIWDSTFVDIWQKIFIWTNLWTRK